MNDDAFLTAFETRTIEEFHHRDHIKVAYSTERLKTWEAKRGFIEPDVAPLASTAPTRPT